MSLGILNIETYNPNWRNDGLTIDLTKDEGNFLKRQIITNCPDSLIAFILENRISLPEQMSFYDLDSGGLPHPLKEYYDMAVEFSEFNYALVVVYKALNMCHVEVPQNHHLCR